MAWLAVTTLLCSLALCSGFAGLMRGAPRGRPFLGATLGLLLGPLGLLVLARIAPAARGAGQIAEAESEGA